MKICIMKILRPQFTFQGARCDKGIMSLGGENVMIQILMGLLIWDKEDILIGLIIQEGSPFTYMSN